MRAVAVVGVVTALVLTGCTAVTSGAGRYVPTPGSSTVASSAGSRVVTSAPSTVPPPADKAQQALAAMSVAQRVGQLFMVDCPSSGVAPATLTAITADDVGSVILDGNSQLSVGQTAAIAAQLQAAAPSGVGLFISTDQEGGQVQRMRGPGFQPIASAVAQGGLASATLRSDAKVWGAQLAAAGINLDPRAGIRHGAGRLREQSSDR